MNFYLDLNDRRLNHLKNKFSGCGLNTFDFCENIETITSDDIIVLSPAYKLGLEEVEKLPNNVTLFSFNLTSEVQNALKQKNIKHINFMQDELFVLKNASLTAECVLSELLIHTELSLYKMNILILGGGRVAKALGQVFNKLGLNFTFTTIDETELKPNKTFLTNCIDWNSFKDNLKNYNVVVNTIPAPLFNNTDESKFYKNGFVFEIASKKCLENVEVKNFNYILCPTLPSKYTPKSAGDLLEEVIKKHIKFNA